MILKMFYFKKAVLINLLLKYFLDNLSNEKYPNNVISVSKRDIVNIKEISYPLVVKRFKLNCSLIDLSKLERLSKHQIFEYMIFFYILILNSFIVFKSLVSYR